jgi:hypothetical protein
LFVPPDGIVPSMGYDESLSAGFDESTGEDGWVFWRLSSPRDALERDFFEAIRLLPAVLGIGIGIAHHWEETENEFWTDAKDAFTTAEAVTAFFIQHRADTLASGFVDLVVFVPPEGETRLLLTEHKQLQLETRDAALIERFAARFSALGYAKKPEAASCANDVHHWHYRPAATLDRKGFVRFLRRQGFMLRETWAAEEA